MQGAKHARGDIPIACKDLGFLVCLMGMHTLETTRIFSYGIFAPLAEFVNSTNKPCMCVIFSVEIQTLTFAQRNKKVLFPPPLLEDRVCALGHLPRTC